MPPKPRGSLRGRGRGRGAGAVGVARATAASPEQSEPTATATEASAAPETIVPKTEDGDGAASSAIDLSATGESQLAPDSSTSSPQTVASSSARPPVQRLDTLKTPAPPSRSASPAAKRGAATRGGRKAVVKPTFTGRRSKEERDAREKLDRERQKERDKEADAKAERKRKAEERLAKRGGLANSRGGYSGPITGPFSLGSSTQDRKSARSSNPYGGGSGSRAINIKSEYSGGGSGGGGGGGGSGGGGGGGGGSSGIKREDGIYVEESSDDEENPEYKRKDIDLIEISSDEGEDKTAPPRQRERIHNLPVRISRKEHHDRVVGINTDASADTPIKPTKDAEAPVTEAAEGASRKGKGKAKDLEITSVRKPYKGMWQEDSEPQPIKIKAEPMNSDDEDTSPTEEPAEEVGITSATNLNEENPQISALDGASMPKVKSKVVPEPVMQTDEDRQEWARFQANLQHIRAELGPGAEVEDVDAVGDVVMGEAGAAKEKKQSVRDNNVYLFQIPPIMPDLLPPTVKSEPMSEPSALAPPPGQKPQPAIKLEEGASASMPKATTASGYVGKLRVHASGRTTLDWGGTSYELNPGHKANYLQEVVQLHVVPENERVVEEDGGEATSFGRVKGKFVVVPAWGAMLG